MNFLASILIVLMVGAFLWVWVVAKRRASEVRRLAAEMDAFELTLKSVKERLTKNLTSHYVSDVPRAADWTKIDRDQMAGLLASDFGNKLITRLKATEYELAVSNAQDLRRPEHSAGITVGYNHCLRQILSLSQSACVVAEKPNDSGAPDGEARPIERESLEYEARMSP